MEQPKLFMLLLGCKPERRNTEQHDTLFAIGHSLKELIPQIESFWPDSGRIHIDGWREINFIDGFNIKVVPHSNQGKTNTHKLFFLNLGGYKENEFEEFHYKILSVAADKAEAIKNAKQSAFFKHTGFAGADSHIDDKYGVDVDDIHEIADILPTDIKERFHIHIEKSPGSDLPVDKLNLGYFKLSNL